MQFLKITRRRVTFYQIFFLTVFRFLSFSSISFFSKCYITNNSINIITIVNIIWYLLLLLLLVVGVAMPPSTNSWPENWLKIEFDTDVFVGQINPNRYRTWLMCRMLTQPLCQHKYIWTGSYISPSSIRKWTKKNSLYKQILA